MSNTTTRNTVTVGTGRAIHMAYGFDGVATWTLCGAGNGIRGGAVRQSGAEVTCKRCVKHLAADIEKAYAEAVELDEQRTIGRAYGSVPSDVVLLAEEIDGLYRAAMIRRDRDEAASDAIAFQVQQAENMDRIVAEDWDAAHAEQAKRAEFAAATVKHIPSARYPWQPECACGAEFRGYAAQHAAQLVADDHRCPEFKADDVLRNPATGAVFRVIEWAHAVIVRNAETGASSAIPAEMARQFERVTEAYA